MADDATKPDVGAESEPSQSLSDEETKAVAKRKSGSARVVHEVVRLQGDEELDRPAVSLLLSGLAGGLSISASVFVEAALKVRVGDAPWADLIWCFGYPIGFIIVILGRLQLFTESTVTAVLPLATHPTLRNLGRLGRLWLCVLVANLAGTLLVAWFIVSSNVVPPANQHAIFAIAHQLAARDWGPALLNAIPSGFLIASVAWILPNAEASKIWVVLVITYAIGICGFGHIIAGSTEVFALWLTGQITFAHLVGGCLLPVLVGNLIGGTGLFALLAHGQVKGEI